MPSLSFYYGPLFPVVAYIADFGTGSTLAASAPNTEGQTSLSLNNPVYNSDGITFRATGENNVSGVTFDSMEWNHASPLIEDLYSLPHNQSQYTSANDLFNHLGLLASGDADRGWIPSIVPGTTTLVTNHTGDPGFDYDIMDTGRSQDAVFFAEYRFFETNGTPGNQPITMSILEDPNFAVGDLQNYDATPVITGSDLANALEGYFPADEFDPTGDPTFKGYQDIDNSFYDSGKEYYLATPADAIPEPSTGALAVLALAIPVFRRRRQDTKYDVSDK